MKTPEQLQAEAEQLAASFVPRHAITYPHLSKTLAAWAARIQQDAVAEERKALREIIQGGLSIGTGVSTGFPLGHEARSVLRGLLATLDARSKP